MSADEEVTVVAALVDGQALVKLDGILKIIDSSGHVETKDLTGFPEQCVPLHVKDPNYPPSPGCISMVTLTLEIPFPGAKKG